MTSPIVVIAILGAAGICALSMYLSNKVHKQMVSEKYLQPWERFFLFKKMELIRKINSCADPIQMDYISQEIDALLMEGAHMVDEVMYTQAIIDVQGAFEKKTKSFTRKS